MPKDLIIIGGGPGGVSTALHLAQIAPELAPRILILERARYPRPKLCGGALLWDAEIILEQLGLDIDEVQHVDAAEHHLDFEGEGLLYSLPGAPAFRVIQREEFDAWLAGHAKSRGIQIEEGVRVRNVRPGRDSVVVETDSGVYEALAVVGADGSTGVTRRCVLPDAPLRVARALEVMTPIHEGTVSQSDDAADKTRLQRPKSVRSTRDVKHGAETAYFDFFPVSKGIAGFTWDFPAMVRGQPMRCWGIGDTNLNADLKRPPLRDSLAEEMRLQGYDLKDYELQGHPIPWFSPFNRFSVPRVILVGDAAGTDGMFGAGINTALKYGAVAATALRDAVATGDFSFRDYGRRVVVSKLGRELSIRWAYMYVAYKLRWAWYQKLLWRVLNPLLFYLARASRRGQTKTAGA